MVNQRTTAPKPKPVASKATTIGSHHFEWKMHTDRCSSQHDVAYFVDGHEVTRIDFETLLAFASAIVESNRPT